MAARKRKASGKTKAGSARSAGGRRTRKKAATKRAAKEQAAKKKAAGAARKKATAKRTGRKASGRKTTGGRRGASTGGVTLEAVRWGRFEARPELTPVVEPEVHPFGLLAPDGTPLVRDPIATAGLSRAAVLRIYRTMQLVRALDERMMTLQRQGRIGFYGAHTGQEAVPAAAAEALEDRDWIFPALREGPIMLHRGFDLFTYVSQIFGNAADLMKGRNMPSHMAARAVNQVSWSSVIGPQITQAAGAAYASRRLRDGALAVAFMGDGATSSADFHTGLNFASVWKVPALFVCQNNQWAISVPTHRQTGSRTIAQKAVAYGLPGYQVDGNDALAVYAAVRSLARTARAGGGPAFLECLTYRIGAHSSSDDPRVYRDEGEVEAWRARDPLDRLRRFLHGAGLLTEKTDRRWKEEAEAQVLDAVRRAEAEPPPPRESLFDDVYATRPWHLEEQARELFAVIQEGD